MVEFNVQDSKSGFLNIFISLLPIFFLLLFVVIIFPDRVLTLDSLERLSFVFLLLLKGWDSWRQSIKTIIIDDIIFRIRLKNDKIKTIEKTNVISFIFNDTLFGNECMFLNFRGGCYKANQIDFREKLISCLKKEGIEYKVKKVSLVENFLMENRNKRYFFINLSIVCLILLYFCLRVNYS